MSPAALVAQVDLFRIEAGHRFDRAEREGSGQFFTPLPTARLMASMFGPVPLEVSLLDAGAGVGSLIAAWVADICQREERPERILVTAYEIDTRLLPYLSEAMDVCRQTAASVGVALESRIIGQDFIQAAVEGLPGSLFAATSDRFDAAILNPPYKKLGTRSKERQMLRAAGVDAGNMYAAFVLLSANLLRPQGQLVAITPRSFCNGPYFKPFRARLLRELSIRRLHVFHARDRAFGDDSVLQENVIISAVKSRARRDEMVEVSASEDAESDCLTSLVPLSEIVRPDDSESVIWIPEGETAERVKARMARFSSTLPDLGLTVSTGRVVDFRARRWLGSDTDEGVVPLVYPANLVSGRTQWPVPIGKPNAIRDCEETRPLLVPSDLYVLVKRFSSKEEPRRLVAAVFEPDSVGAPVVGFENHLNYFHANGKGLDEDLALGLAGYLNSALVDDFFRLFSGHTQVNAADLRRLPYPSAADLEALGRLVRGGDNDADLPDELAVMAGRAVDSAAAENRIAEARSILASLGLPRQQVNERSALTLLALLDLRPSASWTEAKSPHRGITPMMEFMSDAYGKRYAPNTRETIRRQTIHQFLDAGLIVQNPDRLDRPTNSPDTVYRIEAGALGLLRSFGTTEWDQNLVSYLAAVTTLREQYAAEREMARLPVTLANETLLLSPGGQNVLIKQIVEEFGPRFTPGGRVLYIGDADEKWALFERDGLRGLGVEVDAHGKMPDVVIHHENENWLVLVEAVTSHGPVDAKRHGELRKLFAGSTAGLVYVTAFLDRATMARYLRDISWETEVWVSESPSHLVHFNGERFLGPHDS